MPSFLSRVAVPAFLRATRANRVFSTAEAAIDHIRERSLRPLPYHPPRHLRSDVSVTVERVHGWPVYSLTPRSGRSTGCVVYTHGGGWVNEIAPQHWALAADICAHVGTTVVVPIYPLVPFGTAEQVVAGVAELVLANSSRYGEVCLGGDSAGGQIALSTAVLLRDEHGVRLPRTVLISPSLDLAMTNPEMDVVQAVDPWLAKPGARVFIEHWRGRLPLSDPRVSPLCADLTGLGPLTVFCGTRDILVPDTRLLVQKARAAGVEVDHHERDGLVHVYPLTPTPEGRAARRTIIESLRAALAVDATR
ncbi:alpha/beta hydrolase fold domain-containing protein [Nocardia sp. NPDC050406]|uniref:alpha/beta hydrolase fold domain-containing protein n=1 Tax=Nocardia sp. NPDC050406 TaxID=3364318 RepID=UPI0037928BF5